MRGTPKKHTIPTTSDSTASQPSAQGQPPASNDAQGQPVSSGTAPGDTPQQPPLYYNEEYTPRPFRPPLLRALWIGIKRLPLGILTLPWIVLKLVLNRLFGEFAGRRALRAYQRGEYVEQRTSDVLAGYRKYFDGLNNDVKKNVNVKWINVKTDHANIDTVELSPKEKKETGTEGQETNADNTAQQSRPYIIRFLGGATRYRDHIDEAMQEVREHDCHIVLFDYRGVGLSTGKLRSQWDLVKDGIRQVQRLIEAKVPVPAAAIVLDGHDLGGAVATLVAKYFHDRGVYVKVFNDRSFSSRTNLRVAQIRGMGHADGYSTSSFGRTLGEICRPFIKFMLSSVEWDMNAGKAFRSLSPEMREEMVVRSWRSGGKKMKYSSKPQSTDDSEIPYSASMHAALRTWRRGQKRALEVQIPPKSAEVTDDEYARETHKQIKAAVSDPHKAVPATGASNGHNAARADLLMRCPPPGAQPSTEGGAEKKPGYTAQRFFWRFVECDGNSKNYAAGQSQNNRRQVAKAVP
jgi:pimeloyl-ACP methyl ester carboxylesterase